MDWIKYIFDFIMHIDVHLKQIVTTYGFWSYGILFLIIFAETGLVVTPFLPGDSLLFAAGALSAIGILNPIYLLVLLVVAAILGDTVNYSVGKYTGVHVFTEESKIFKLKYLRKTEGFFEKYGGKTIVLARFVPIVRTYAPFVAGASTMTYAKFVLYNVLGGALWVGLFVLAGYFFGNLPIVANNFTLVVLAIIVMSLVPITIELFKSMQKKRRIKS